MAAYVGRPKPSDPRYISVYTLQYLLQLFVISNDLEMYGVQVYIHNLILNLKSISYCSPPPRSKVWLRPRAELA